jgi:membrane-associated phospholipid phosphatase
VKFAFALFILSSLAIPPQASAQTSEPDQTSPAPASTPAQAPPVSQPLPPAERPVSWKLLLPNIIADQERIWTFPARLAQGQNLLPAASLLGATAGLVALGPIEAGYFRRSSTFKGFNNYFTSNVTIAGTIAAPVSFYMAGLIRKDSKMQRTALFAGEAVADSEVLATVLKDATRRVRPSGIPPGGNYYDSWFESGGSPFRANGGFPSGHIIAAFSIATVVARRYGNHRWVPYAAYGLAAAVGFSRLSLSAHFFSDVFVGGALGYAISRFAVLRQ